MLELCQQDEQNLTEASGKESNNVQRNWLNVDSQISLTLLQQFNPYPSFAW